MGAQRERDIMTVIADLPEICTSELVDLCPQWSKTDIGYALTGLVRQGKLVVGEKPSPKKHGRRTVKTYSLATSKPKPPELKLVPAQDVMAELAELRAFKARAIKQYPDLGVDPIVLKARSIVAQYTNVKPKDDSPIMLSTIAALQEAA